MHISSKLIFQSFFIDSATNLMKTTFSKQILFKFNLGTFEKFGWNKWKRKIQLK